MVMPIGDPQDRFFYPTLTLGIDSYNLTLVISHTESMRCPYIGCIGSHTHGN